MDLKQINYFMRVYEEGSFSKAAAKANVVQSALSMQIRRIEDEFGVLLFNRLSRGVEPTEAGRKFYARCVPIARNFALAQDELSEGADRTLVTGSVHVGLPGTFNKGLLSGILLPFMEQFPEVQLTISEAYTGTLVDWVRDGVVDFALGSRPAEADGLIQRLLYRDRVMLMSGAPLNGTPFRACDLGKVENLKLILPGKGQSFGSSVQSYIANGLIKATRTIEINGTVGAMELARGSDWGLLTPFISVCREPGQSGAYIYPVESPALSFDLYLVYDKRRPLTAAARQFIAAIEQELRAVDGLWREIGLSGG